MTGFVGKVSEIGRLRPDSLGGDDGFRNTHVGRVRSPPEGIEHQDPDAPQLLHLGGTHRFHIGQVGQLPEAIPEDAQVSVGKGEGKHLLASHGHRRAGIDAVELQLGLGGSLKGPLGIEDVAERGLQAIEGFSRTVDGDCPSRGSSEVQTRQLHPT
jgi:hypothetical protein